MCDMFNLLFRKLHFRLLPFTASEFRTNLNRLVKMNFIQSKDWINFDPVLGLAKNYSCNIRSAPLFPVDIKTLPSFSESGPVIHYYHVTEKSTVIG